MSEAGAILTNDAIHVTSTTTTTTNGGRTATTTTTSSPGRGSNSSGGRGRGRGRSGGGGGRGRGGSSSGGGGGGGRGSSSNSGGRGGRNNNSNTEAATAGEEGGDIGSGSISGGDSHTNHRTNHRTNNNNNNNNNRQRNHRTTNTTNTNGGGGGGHDEDGTAVSVTSTTSTVTTRPSRPTAVPAAAGRGRSSYHRGGRGGRSSQQDVSATVISPRGNRRPTRIGAASDAYDPDDAAGVTDAVDVSATTATEGTATAAAAATTTTTTPHRSNNNNRYTNNNNSKRPPKASSSSTASSSSSAVDGDRPDRGRGSNNSNNNNRGGRSNGGSGGGREGRGSGRGSRDGRNQHHHPSNNNNNNNNNNNRKGETSNRTVEHHSTATSTTPRLSTTTIMNDNSDDFINTPPPAVMSEQQLSTAIESIFNATAAAAAATTKTTSNNVDDELKKLLSIPLSSSTSENDPFLSSLHLTGITASTTAMPSSSILSQPPPHLNLPPTPSIYLAATTTTTQQQQQQPQQQQRNNATTANSAVETSSSNSNKKSRSHNRKGGRRGTDVDVRTPIVITRETVYTQQQQQQQQQQSQQQSLSQLAATDDGLYNDEPHLSELLAEAALFDDDDDDDVDDKDNHMTISNNVNVDDSNNRNVNLAAMSSSSFMANNSISGGSETNINSFLLSQQQDISQQQQQESNQTATPTLTTKPSTESSTKTLIDPSSSFFDTSKGDATSTNATTAMSSSSATSSVTIARPLPSLPPIPTSMTGRGGVMILTRNPQHHHPTASSSSSSSAGGRFPSSSTATSTTASMTATSTTGNFDNASTITSDTNTNGKVEAANKSKKKQSQKKKKVPATTTASDTLKAIPTQEVDISSSTHLKVKRIENAMSLQEAANSGGSLLGGASSNYSKKNNNDPSTNAKKGKSKNQSSSKKGFLINDVRANRTAANQFNNDVKMCVEKSDPDGLHELLHDPNNHNFALDAEVLEIVMKAYVMAAMFDDALYCLRNCALPSTLSTIQTERILACMPQNLRSSNAYTAADMINQLCINTIFDNATSRTYFLRIVRGIALEFLEEAMSARDRICSAPCERLVRAGTCVVDARLERGKKPADLIVVPGDQLGVWQSDTLENRGIQAGDAVSILPYAGPYPMSAESLDRNMIEATITNTNPMVLRLQDKANAKLHAMLTEDIEGNVLRIDKLANRMGFNRQLAAAVAIASPLGDVNSDTYVRDLRRPCPEIIQAVTAMNENFEQFMNNKETSNTSKLKSTGGAGHTTLTSTAALCATAVPWNLEDEINGMDQDSIRATARLTLEKYGALEGLNESQQLAVECATTNRLTLVQGPPGTGKTRIAICILQHWGRLAVAAAEKGQDPAPILATSDSNIAVDNLVEGCSAVGLRVVRLGRPEAIRPELLRFCIDRPPSSYDKNATANGNAKSQGNAHKERMNQLKSAQIICCTCIGSGGDILDALGPFERVLVDEATQATEPAVLVPLMRGCRQLVLVGDHCQLPPTVLSTRAEEEGHGVPLFSRMVACGVPPHMLDTQYRMHPGIAMFPSDLFYGGLLKNGVSAPERRPLAGFPWPREEFPVAFIPVRGVEMDDGVSKYNEEEANAACEAVDMLLRGGQCSVSDIAVVTPYAAQARLIRRMTRRMTGNSGPPFIEVSSVDGFQGREKEAVVFSAVRSNDYGAIGFTSDWRRINVSFTRARRALVVIGNDLTLRRGDPDTWMPWLAWADAHGVNVEKPGIARGRYEPEQLRRVRGGTTAAEMLKDVLARQQAQLKQAEHQQERAVKNSAGHIIGNEDVNDGLATAPSISLEEDLARLQNTDGNWDDSDDEGENDPNNKKELAHSGSRITLASGASSNDVRSSGDNGDDNSTGPLNVWDL